MTYREEAEAHRDLYFDHLGARQLSAGFEVWLRLRSADGAIVLITMTTDGSSTIPSVSDLWAGAAWCEREASEGYDLTFDGQNSPLLVDQNSRGYLRKERPLSARAREWPGSFDPAGKSVKPIGVNS